VAVKSCCASCLISFLFLCNMYLLFELVLMLIMHEIIGLEFKQPIIYLLLLINHYSSAQQQQVVHS
jgi:hypothetical protein